MSEHDTNALIVGAGFTIGDVRGKGTLILNGTVEGNIVADTVKLSETGLVNGHIQCAQLDTAGKINGGFTSNDVIVRPGAMVTASTDLVSKGTCLIAGTVNANLKANQLKIETGGNLNGQVQAQQLDVHGNINGHVDATDAVVRKGARIDGNISYGDLAMERGSDIGGQLQRKTKDGGASRSPQAAAPSAAIVRIDLPINMLREKVKNPDAKLQLSSIDGTDLPGWLKVGPEANQLHADKVAFEAFVLSGKTLSLRLQLGNESITFVLPPEAKTTAA